jgi:hypothetical protein
MLDEQFAEAEFQNLIELKFEGKKYMFPAIVQQRYHVGAMVNDEGSSCVVMECFDL